MGPSDKQIELVENSFSLLAPNSQQVAQLFYQNLFTLDPSLSALFSSDMTQQGQKLMTMLGIAVAHLRDLDTLVPELQQLAIRHRNYGTKASHFDTLNEAFLLTLQTGLAEQYDKELEQAWLAILSLVADTMKPKLA